MSKIAFIFMLLKQTTQLINLIECLQSNFYNQYLWPAYKSNWKNIGPKSSKISRLIREYIQYIKHFLTNATLFHAFRSIDYRTVSSQYVFSRLPKNVIIKFYFSHHQKSELYTKWNSFIVDWDWCQLTKLQMISETQERLPKCQQMPHMPCYICF